MNIFVGNLSFEAKEEDVQRAFMAFGVVTSVAIVMEKKGKKSRGFGFVEMPDEQEALAAIAQLQGVELLGRPINVTPALSKEPKRPAAPKQDPSFKRTGKYKEGRRSLSYTRKRQESGIAERVPGPRFKSNPMRWLKKPRSPARFTKPEGEPKPWQRTQTESKPWKKPQTKSGSWKKPEGEFKPAQRPQGESKPWERKRSESSQARPWKKTASVVKPWRKSSADRAQSGVKKPRRFSKP